MCTQGAQHFVHRPRGPQPLAHGEDAIDAHPDQEHDERLVDLSRKAPGNTFDMLTLLCPACLCALEPYLTETSLMP
jgi:hypothetical protein